MCSLLLVLLQVTVPWPTCNMVLTACAKTGSFEVALETLEVGGGGSPPAWMGGGEGDTEDRQHRVSWRG